MISRGFSEGPIHETASTGMIDEQSIVVESLPIRKGEELILTPDSVAFEGGCVARVNDLAVFVSGCVPGDTVRALVMRKKRRHAEARTLEVLSPSPSRVQPLCD